MKRIIWATIILCIAFADQAKAQYDLRLSQYFLSRNFYNAGYVGATDNLNITALSRLDWIGVHGAPKSFFGMADRPFKLGSANIGAGLIAFTESVGLFQNTQIAVQGAYRHKLLGGMASLGLQLGLASESFDGTKVYIPESDYHESMDGAIPTSSVSGQSFDMSAGLYYERKDLFAGVGVMHIMEPEIQMSDSAATFLTRSYNLMAGYNIKLENPLLVLQPSIFVLTDLQNFHYDITARVEYNKMFNGGIAWRPGESVGILFGANIKRFQVGYAYDYPITSLSKATTGSHEIVLRYNLKLHKTKTGKNRHKSVRIL